LFESSLKRGKKQQTTITINDSRPEESILNYALRGLKNGVRLKMLQEQTLAYVEGALQGTNPGHAFTVGVLAALPLSVAPAKALAFGAAVKGSSSAKTLASFATVGALGALILHWSLLGFLAFAGVCAGFWMSRAAEQSDRQCKNAMGFWRAFALTFAICFVARQVLFFRLFGGRGPASYLPWFTMPLLLDSSYLVTVIVLALWMARWFREAANPETKIQDFPGKLKRRLILWLSLGLIGPACWFVPIAGGMLWQIFSPPVIRHLSAAEFRRQMEEIVRERNYGWCILMDKDGKKTVQIDRPEHDGSERWTAPVFGLWKRWAGGTKPAWWNLWNDGSVPQWWTSLMYWSGWRPDEVYAAADESTPGFLREKGISYHTEVSNPKRRFSRDAWPIGSLLPFFVAPMGAVMIVRQLGKRQRTATAAGVFDSTGSPDKYGKLLLAVRSDIEARKLFWLTFGGAFVLVFGVNAFTTNPTFTVSGFYVIGFHGAIKGIFFGLVAGVCALYFRLERKPTKAAAG
ncbi:MAG: hypothetical protein ACLQVW_17440, partial [Limisphaerales bacterium]